MMNKADLFCFNFVTESNGENEIFSMRQFVSCIWLISVGTIFVGVQLVGKGECTPGNVVCDAGNRNSKGCFKNAANQGVKSVSGGNHGVNYTDIVGESLTIKYPQTKPLESPQLAVGFSTEDFEQYLVFPFVIPSKTGEKKHTVVHKNILLFSLTEKFYPLLRIYQKEKHSGKKQTWTKVSTKKDSIPDPAGNNKVPDGRGVRYYELTDECDYLAVVATKKGDLNVKSKVGIKEAEFLIYFTSDTTQYWAPINGLWFNGRDGEKGHHKNEKAVYDFNTKSHGKATLYFGKHKNDNGTFNPSIAYINPAIKSIRIHFSNGTKWHCVEISNGRRSSIELIPNSKGINDQLNGTSNFPDDCMMNIQVQNNLLKGFVEKVLGSIVTNGNVKNH